MLGLLNLHKPAGVTSRDVVNQVQRLVRPAKVGHAGTLDPLATGVLVVCIGPATRLVEYVQRFPKTYVASFILGKRSDTDDIEGLVTDVADAPVPSLDEIVTAAAGFVGDISQRPPAFSAVKVKGARAYALARQGHDVELAERMVKVHSLQVLRYEYPELELAIECGSGTYVRSIGRDLAESLGTAAVMNRLVRTSIGPFQIDSAIDPNSLTSEALQSVILPVNLAVSGLPAVALNECEVALARRGQYITRLKHGFNGDIAAFDPGGSFVAVLVARDANTLRPEKVL